MGNVLFQYDPQTVLQALVPTNPYHTYYLTHFLNHQRWQNLDAGTVSIDAVISQLAAVIPDPTLPETVAHIVHNFVHHLTLINDTRKLFLTLKKHYPIYLLTNFQAVPFSKLREIHPFLYQADGAIVSAHHGCIKPDPAIYNILLTTHSITPNETVFIDDMAENVQTAQSLGMNAIQYTSFDSLENALIKLGVTLF